MTVNKEALFWKVLCSNAGLRTGDDGVGGRHGGDDPLHDAWGAGDESEDIRSKWLLACDSGDTPRARQTGLRNTGPGPKDIKNIVKA